MKGRYKDENLYWVPVLIGLVILLPFLLKSITFSYKYYLFVFNIAGIYIILAVGLDLLSGFTGLISLGHAAFLAIRCLYIGHFGGSGRITFHRFFDYFTHHCRMFWIYNWVSCITNIRNVFRTNHYGIWVYC